MDVTLCMNAIPSGRMRYLQLSRLPSASLVLLLLVVTMNSCAVPGLRGYYTPSEAYPNAASLAGRRISIQGEVQIIAAFCTESVCPPDNPCCNACSYRLGFRLDDRRSIYFSGPYGGCTGDSCRADCVDIEPGAMYRVTGIFEKPHGAGIYFQVEEWKRVG
jgi:hypothetical protein